MPLTPGTRLGHYEIISSLGAGGMGEVYRARDSRLGRIVAIKILSSELSGNADARRRFEREAHAVSSLNHPHICALHDVGHEDDIDYLVLEHLEGETLSSRLTRGALPLNEAVRYAIEITAALDGAHRCGVVHRDLKPGNVMLTKFGAKLLDFGLARLKPVVSASGAAEPTMTVEAPLVGTVPYMSPEQIEGKEADARSDIFSAGIVIHEMVAGRRPFEGDSSAAVMAAILKTEPPPMSRSRPDVPPALEHLVGQCLAKNPEERRQSAHDLGLDLRWILESLTRPETAPAHAGKPSRGTRVGWIAAAVGLAALVAALLIVRAPHTASPQGAIRFSLDVPKGTTISEPFWSHPSVSPDGRTVAFVVSGGGESGLWIRPLDAPSARRLPGTDGALSPFWSPDSGTIAFFADGKLKATSPAGEAPRSICDVPSIAVTGSWGSTGTIVFRVSEAPDQDGLYRVSASGGTPSRIRVRDASGEELVETAVPHFLPDGRFLLLGTTAKGEEGLFLATLDSERAERIPYDGPMNTRVEYAPPGYLLSVAEGTLVAQRFDARSGRLEGSPVPIAESVAAFGSGARFSISSNGVLVHGPTWDLSSRLTWFDREGNHLGSVGGQAMHGTVRLSPDERRLAVEIQDARTDSTDIQIFELPEGISTRLAAQKSNVEFSPVWSPDGREIAYTSPMGNPPNLFRRRLGGQDAERLVPPSGHAQWASDWSPDGRSILYVDRDPSTWADLWVLHLDGDRKPVPWLQTSFSEYDARFSPDGNWVAYVSNETGRFEVYVRPFRGAGEKRRVSSAGGRHPRWRGDGKEIFYTDSGEEPALVSVMVVPSTMEIIGAPRSLFHLSDYVRDYDVTSDGQRFLINHEDAGAGSLGQVVVNWTAIGGP